MNSRKVVSPPIEFEDSDPLLNTVADFEEAARFLDLESWIINRLRHTEREVTVTLSLTRDHGEETVVTGLRVQHYSGIGPTLGPVRIAPDSSLHRLRATAMTLTWQMALLELPFGGAAGGILCAPEQHTERELKTLARAYTHTLGHTLGPATDVLTPGRGCNEQTMAWFLSGLDVEVSLAPGNDPRQLATVLGKPEMLWGLPQAGNARAQGLCSLLRCLLPDLAGRRVSLQGFGHVGSGLAHLLHAAQIKVIAVADASGGLYSMNGLDVPAVATHAGGKGMLYGFPQAEAVSNADVLEAECDVLVTAAGPCQIHAANADSIRASMVIETSPGAITRAAEEKLARRGVVLVPHLLATLGDAIAGAAEWKQNMQFPSSIFDLIGDIELRVRKVHAQVSAAARQNELNLRQAALVLALKRLSEQMRLTSRNN